MKAELFLGTIELDVKDGACDFPEEWSRAKSMALRWVRTDATDRHWYQLAPEEQIPEMMEEELSSHRTTVMGIAEFLKDGRLKLPEDIRNVVELSGSAERIDVLPQEETAHRKSEFKKMFGL